MQLFKPRHDDAFTLDFSPSEQNGVYFSFYNTFVSIIITDYVQFKRKPESAFSHSSTEYQWFIHYPVPRPSICRSN